jgi:sugar lactone lactonase YvrE
MRCALVAALLLNPYASAAKVTLVAGGGTAAPPGPAVRAKLSGPAGIDFDRAGNLFIAEADGHRLLKLDTNGLLSVVAGTGDPGDLGDNGPALSARFVNLRDVAAASDGIVYTCDAGAHKVRRVDLLQKLTAIAGTGARGSTGDGRDARKAELATPAGIALDEPRNRLIIADTDNRRVRQLDLTTGILTTIAGSGQPGIPKDGGRAVAQPLVDPRAVAVDAIGNVYVLERKGHALRLLSTDGTIRTVVNAAGQVGAGGDGGPAATAKLSSPTALALDRLGDVYIADTGSNAVRRYRVRLGVVDRICGSGTPGSAGLDGPPERAELNRPQGVRFGTDGRLHIADTGNNRIVRVDP